MSTDPGLSPADPVAGAAGWKATIARFRHSSTRKAVWQLINSFGPYMLVWYAMWWSSSVSYWLTLPLCVLAVGFLVRIFIIFHDCGHGSFFKSKVANDTVGFIAGVFTFTPYFQWRWEHGIHHGTSGDLDRRGMGDIWTLTVQEYLESSRWRRFAYRMARNPVVLFILAPFFVFILGQRFPKKNAPRRERHSVYWMNLALLGVAIPLCFVFGWKQYLLIQVTVTTIAGMVGIWLFYVQHQFEAVYWGRGANWDPTKAAMEGSSFYKLPKILQWFSGNIGFHHIHHLSPRIPNYNLERCHDADPVFQQVKPMTLLVSMKSLAYRLFDERRKVMVGFRHLRLERQQHTRGPQY